MIEFYNERNLTAHKEHICFICNTVIPVNQNYIRCSGKYEGDFFDLCVHENCNKLLNAFLDESKLCEYEPEWIREWIADIICNKCNNSSNCKRNVCMCEHVLSELISDKTASGSP